MNIARETLKSQLLSSSKSILAPGVYDSMTALLAEQAGFDAVYLSGASIAYTHLARSDVGLTTYSEVEQILSRITDRTDINVIVDADTGFGNELNVIRTVKGFEKAGASMIQIEDQSFPKRCGHLANKRVVSAGEMRGKLEAALDARRSTDTLILARTDAIAVEGFESALDRAELYVETGIDALFVEALHNEEQMQILIDRFSNRIPLLINMVEGGITPILPADELQKKGFKIVIFPGGAARAMTFSLQRYYQTLFTHKTTAPLASSMFNFDELNHIIETPKLLKLAAKYHTE